MNEFSEQLAQWYHSAAALSRARPLSEHAFATGGAGDAPRVAARGQVPVAAATKEQPRAGDACRKMGDADDED